MNFIAWIAVYDLSRLQLLEVVFFDIGQGDAIFIKTVGRQQILIDGGPDLTILEKLAKEMPFYDRTIDLVILTHPESDHLFGLLEVLKRYKVKNILWTGIVRETAEWEEWNKLIKKEGAEIKIAQAGQRIIFSSGQNSRLGQNSYDRGNFDRAIFFEILFPFENLTGQVFENSNDTSIVIRLVFDNVSFLFTGDITKKTEQKLVILENYLLDSGALASLDSQVLKVAHHGSRTSSSPEFLEKVLPEIAVIQVGRNNRYGHPHPEVLANLEQFGINVLRTDIAGNIKIFSDGENLKIPN